MFMQLLKSFDRLGQALAREMLFKMVQESLISE